MEGRQRVAKGRNIGARGDGVKTKNGCEDVFWGQILLAKGVVNKYFSENSSDLSDNFLPSRPEKSQITQCVDAPNLGSSLDSTLHWRVCVNRKDSKARGTPRSRSRVRSNLLNLFNLLNFGARVVLRYEDVVLIS